ncbi:ATP-binding protein, partial [Streptomyces caniscabiei]
MSDRPALGRSLAGRGDEIAALTRSIGSVRAGHPTLMLVGGPAGIGKTALVEQALETGRGSAGGAGLRVLRVTGVAWESDLRFGVADQLVRFAGRAAGSEPGGGAALPDPASPDAV